MSIKPYGIYLSSTLSDLAEERKNVIDVLTSAGFAVKQSYSASEDNLIKSCVDDVAKCHVYVAIIAMRYGYCPPDGSGTKSITEMEYERARKENMPCFIFMIDEGNVRSKFNDVNNKDNEDGERIRRFRQRLSEAHRPANFDSVQGLREAVLHKVSDFRRHVEGAQPLMEMTQRHPAELVRDIALILCTGTDDSLANELTPLCGDNHFKLVLVSPDHPELLREVDRNTIDCRAVAWLLTPVGLQRYLTRVDALAVAIDAQKLHQGGSYALLAPGVATTDFRPAWGFSEVVSSPTASSWHERLYDLYAAVRAHTTRLQPDRRIALPCIVLAMTQHEADALAADPQGLLGGMLDEDSASLRAGQLQRLRDAIERATKPKPAGLAAGPAWPTGFYGPTREDWRPFGAGSGRAIDHLHKVIGRINDPALRTGRERLLFSAQDLQLELRPYSFDEFLDDRYGSRGLLEGLRASGCLVLLDEMSLLHPRLREAADQFLTGSRVAVVSLNPCDPAPSSVGAMLTDTAVLNIGALRSRFRDEQDPRCELAVNSVERLERWLRMVLPELVPVLGQREARPELGQRMSDFFATAGAR